MEVVHGIIAVVLATTIFAILRECSGDPIAGPFRVLIDRVELCPPELLDAPFFFHGRAWRDRRHLDSWFITANITLPMPFDDVAQLRLVFASWSSRGGWIDNAHVLKLPRICTTVKTMQPKLFRNVLTALNVKGCPVPPGSYYAPNISIDTTISSVQSFFYGKWRVDGKTVEPSTNKTFTCIRVFCNVVPRYPPVSG